MTAFFGSVECSIDYSSTTKMVARRDYMRRWNRGVLIPTGSNRSPSNGNAIQSPKAGKTNIALLNCSEARYESAGRGLVFVEQLCGLIFIHNDTIHRIICSRCCRSAESL